MSVCNQILTDSQKFELAYVNFKPASDDNPDNVSFYRAFAGLRSAWGEQFYKDYNHVIHHVACCLPPHAECRYADALRQLAFYLDNSNQYKLPEEEPRYQGFYDQEPAYPGDIQIKEFFNQQFAVNCLKKGNRLGALDCLKVALAETKLSNLYEY